LEEVALPDTTMARGAWEAMRRRVASVPRLCRGVDVTHGADLENLPGLDMESRRELLLRQRFHRGGNGTARMAEAFPQAGGQPL
ncbi:MAG TPA: hypothetical protein VM759_07970, partial [Longimicrobium sp.]|nr:hypothetical protein [Longimicrobium sp.]